MGLLDGLLLTGLGLWLLAALRSLRRKPGCCGDCARCGGCKTRHP